MTLLAHSRALAIYVHIPFCARLCPYCDFAVAVRRKPDFAAYADALIAEFDAREAEWQGMTARTLYFGGGTPSLFELSELRRVFEHIDQRISLQNLEETTLESNPASIDPERLRFWRALGISRLSVGVQSFDDRALKALGRNHNGREARRALVESTESGMTVSVDLIFAGPEHTRRILMRDLDALDELGIVDHISAYQLTVEPNTVFGRRAAKGELRLPDEDAAADDYDYLRERLSANGIEQYEVSSHARSGYEAVHNAAYWEGRPYLGLGVGAHSFGAVDGVLARRANPKRLKDYLGALEAMAKVETISEGDHLNERVFLGLRHRGGVSPVALSEAFPGLDSRVWTELVRRLDGLVERRLLVPRNGDYVPTKTGFALADAVAESLLGFEDFLGLPTNS